MGSLPATVSCPTERGDSREISRMPSIFVGSTNTLPHLANKILTDVSNKHYGLSKFYNKVKTESNVDFARFADFKSINIPVQCGDKFGYVSVCFRKQHMVYLQKGFVEGYKACLGQLIEIKKWIESLKEQRDVGPAEAIARLIEDGDYDRFLNVVETKDCDELEKMMIKKEYTQFLKLFGDKKIRFDDFEHILVIKETHEGAEKIYYIMPSRDRLSFKNNVQGGLVKFVVYLQSLHWRSNFGKTAKELYMEDFREWVQGNKESDAELFNTILDESKIIKFNGWSREYSQCLIYEDFFKKAFNKFFQTLLKYEENIH